MKTSLMLANYFISALRVFLQIFLYRGNGLANMHNSQVSTHFFTYDGKWKHYCYLNAFCYEMVFKWLRIMPLYKQMYSIKIYIHT